MVSIFSDSWVDLVFEGRNQHYGAFVLRKQTPRNSFLAGVISLTLFGMAIISPLIIGLLFNHHHKEAIITLIPYEGPTLIPNPKIEQPPAAKPTPEPLAPKPTASVPLTVAKDEDAKDEPKQNPDTPSTAGETKEAGGGNGVPVASGISNPAPPAPVVPDVPVRIAEEMPAYPGGEEALLKYIAQNTHYPVVSKENDIEGTVYVQFVIDKSGNVTDVKVLRSVDRFLDREAVRVIASLPKWTPGKQNGKTVAVYYTIPIRFELR